MREAGDEAALSRGRLVPEYIEDEEPFDEHAAAAVLGPSPLEGADPEARRLVTWLRRQLELYRALKLTPLKVSLLRRLGIKMRRQKGGPDPRELHPGLRFAERRGGGDGDDGAAVPQQVALRVNAITQRGVRVAMELSQHLRAGGDTWRPLLVDGPRDTSDTSVAAWALDERVFMLAMSQLQHWYRRYGRSAPVPPGAWDRPQLAAWVAVIRRVHAAGQQGAGGGQQQQQQLAGQRPPEQQPEVEAEALAAAAIEAGRSELYLRPWQEEELLHAGFRLQGDVRGRGEGAGGEQPA